MATKAQIDRLALRIEQAAAALGPRAPRTVAKIVHDPAVETEQQAMERHFSSRPEDRDATDLILRVIVYPKDWQSDGHKNAN